MNKIRYVACYRDQPFCCKPFRLESNRCISSGTHRHTFGPPSTHVNQGSTSTSVLFFEDRTDRGPKWLSKRPNWLSHFGPKDRNDRGPNWLKTEMDVHFGPRTEVTEDRSDRGPKWMYPGLWVCRSRPWTLQNCWTNWDALWVVDLGGQGLMYLFGWGPESPTGRGTFGGSNSWHVQIYPRSLFSTLFARSRPTTVDSRSC